MRPGPTPSATHSADHPAFIGGGRLAQLTIALTTWLLDPLNSIPPRATRAKYRRTV